MGWKPLLPEGITPVERTKVVALYCDDRLRAAHSLREMTTDWKFFSVGCIYTFGGLDYDIVGEYTQTHADRDCVVMQIAHQRPVFAGMCPPGLPARERWLERELLATPLEFWDGMRDHIAEVGLVDRRRGRYAQVTMQDLEVVDQVAVSKALVMWPVVPTVPITAFGIDGTHHHVGFAARTSTPEDRAAVVKLPIRAQTVRVGRAVLGEDLRPLMASLEVTPAAAAVPDPVDISTLPAARQRELNEAIAEARKEIR